MQPDLRGKAAVVTGASKGIGRAIAEALAENGANVVISARNAEEVERTAAEISGRGGARVIGVAADVRRHDDVRRMIGTARDEFGGLDVLIANAGIGGFVPVDQMPPEQWSAILETNLTGVYLCCHEAIPLLRERGGGWIITMGSLAGRNAFAGGAAYNASKFGLLGFSEAMMLDVRHDGIRVSCIMPGSVNTHFNDSAPRTEDDWKIQPEDLGRAVLDLLAVPARTLPSRIEIRPSRPRSS